MPASLKPITSKDEKKTRFHDQSLNELFNEYQDLLELEHLHNNVLKLIPCGRRDILSKKLYKTRMNLSEISITSPLQTGSVSKNISPRESGQSCDGCSRLIYLDDLEHSISSFIRELKNLSFMDILFFRIKFDKVITKHRLNHLST